MLSNILHLLSRTKIPIDEAPVNAETYLCNLITQNTSEVYVNNKFKGVSEIVCPKQKISVFAISEEADQMALN